MDSNPMQEVLSDPQRLESHQEYLGSLQKLIEKAAPLLESDKWAALEDVMKAIRTQRALQLAHAESLDDVRLLQGEVSTWTQLLGLRRFAGSLNKLITKQQKANAKRLKKLGS